MHTMPLAERPIAQSARWARVLGGEVFNHTLLDSARVVWLVKRRDRTRCSYREEFLRFGRCHSNVPPSKRRIIYNLRRSLTCATHYAFQPRLIAPNQVPLLSGTKYSDKCTSDFAAAASVSRRSVHAMLSSHNRMSALHVGDRSRLGPAIAMRSLQSCLQ